MASLRTFLTVSGFVFRAFVAACLANLRAKLANRFGEFAAASHVSRCHAANLCAIHIERDAARHHFYIVFLQAGGGAVIAGRCACITGIDAGSVL